MTDQRKNNLSANTGREHQRVLLSSAKIGYVEEYNLCHPGDIIMLLTPTLISLNHFTTINCIFNKGDKFLLDYFISVVQNKQICLFTDILSSNL